MIDFPNKQLLIENQPIPFNNKLPELITIPSRTEQFIEVDVINKVKQGFVEQQELAKRVFIPNALVKNINQKAKISVINVNPNEIRIPKPKVLIHEVSQEFQINNVQISKSQRNDYFQSNFRNKTKLVERNKLLEENVRTNHLNQEEKNSLLEICHQYSEIFHLAGDQLTSTKTFKYTIPTNPRQPISCKIYRYPKIHEQEVIKQISKMLDQNIIQNSHSPYSSPVWVIPKQLDASNEKKFRLVVDYRRLNDVTITDSYPLPTIENILDQLVLLCDKQSRSKLKKLAPNYLGPYKILPIFDNNTAELQLAKNKTQTYHFDLLKPYVVSDGENNQEHPTPPLSSLTDSPQPGPSSQVS
ncbi:hypothetical protein QE152_g18132 [Popillia japonica]|uniref:Uncharacterized protein n=1 Tax=Popillia japonica TaxID=7064 RepID=A0AAW1L448_POPJA